MLAEARSRLASLGERVSFVCADLSALAVEARADVVFSTATFHWILDHDRLFATLAGCLKEGGRLHAQCGGAGNLARFVVHLERAQQDPRYAGALAGFRQTWTFATPAETEGRLRRAGFHDVACDLETAPTTFADAATFADFLRVVVARAHLAALPEPLRAPFLDAVVSSALAEGPPSLDYVRLNLRARR
jgi:trans-aconitate 2-methyltransferase